MEGTLVDVISAAEPTELSELVRQLCREVLELRQEVADLRRENLELRQQVGYWKAQHARAVHRVQSTSKPRLRIFAVRTESSKINSSVARAKNRRPGIARITLKARVMNRTPPRRASGASGRIGPVPKRRDYSHLPVVEDLRELPKDQLVCPQCGAALSPSDTEDSEQIEIETRAYRRRIRRRRYQRTCTCSNCPRTVTAPPAPKLIPKGVLGVSIWVEILLDKFASHRPTERLLGQWQFAGTRRGAGHRGWRPGTPRTALSAALRRAARAETPRPRSHRPMKLAGWSLSPWTARRDIAGGCGCSWVRTPWSFASIPPEATKYPRGHFPADARVVLMVDRYSAYKAMAQVKLGQRGAGLLLGTRPPRFCNGRQGLAGAQGVWPWPGLGRIRALYRHDRRRRSAKTGSAEFTAADIELRQTVAAMQAQADAEVADPETADPLPQGVGKPSGTLEWFEPFPGRSANPAGQQCFRAPRARGPALGRKNYYGSGALMERSAGGDAFFPVCHFDPVQDQYPHLANMVPEELCGKWRSSPVRHQSVLTLENVGGQAPRVRHRSQGHFLNLIDGDHYRFLNRHEREGLHCAVTFS